MSPYQKTQNENVTTLTYIRFGTCMYAHVNVAEMLNK